MVSARIDRNATTRRRLAGIAAVLTLVLIGPAVRAASVDLDTGVLDSLGPATPKPPAAKPDAAKPKGKATQESAGKPKPEKPGQTKSSALPKAAPVPPPPKLGPPEASRPPSVEAAKPAAKQPTAPPAADVAAPPPPVADGPPPSVPAAAPPTAVGPGGQARGASVQPPVAPPRRIVGETAARIIFPGEAAELGPEARGALDGLVPRLAANERLRVEVLGYAAPGADASQARRVSLARALAVRSYLVDKGVKTARVDVRALGSRPEGEPADRVDLVLAER
jgi:outer membrane protein OmpA-like peptidoglycan-associated protein